MELLYLYEVLMENEVIYGDYCAETALIVAEHRYQAELKAQSKYPAYYRYTATKIDEIDGHKIIVE